MCVREAVECDAVKENQMVGTKAAAIAVADQDGPGGWFEDSVSGVSGADWRWSRTLAKSTEGGRSDL